MTSALYIPFIAENASTTEVLIFLVVFLGVAIPMLIAFISGAPTVGTPQAVVDQMLALANIKKSEVVVDPGCGDGRFVLTAGKRYGARAIGYELFLFAYIVAQCRNLLQGFPARIKLADGRKANYKEVDVLVFYLLPNPMKKWQKIWERDLRPGSRVLSYAFPIAGWEPKQMVPRDREKNHGPIWVYEVGKNTVSSV